MLASSASRIFERLQSTCRKHDWSKKFLNSEVRRRRSPYVVLNLKTSATTTEIKAAFRNLAKLYHPDLSTLPAEVAKEKMSEIILAYNQLRKGDFLGSRAGDSRVAVACHIFSLEELQADNLHDVYSIRIAFRTESTTEERTTKLCIRRFLPSIERTLEVIAHPEDSVSDLKRQIQLQFEHAWGITHRAKNRDAIRIGWELTCIRKSDLDDDFNPNHGVDLTVMGNNFLISSYGIEHGDRVYAIVRK